MKTSLISVLLFSVGFVASQHVKVSDAGLDPREAQDPLRVEHPESGAQLPADGDYLQAWDEVMKDYGTERWDARLAEFLESLTHDEFNKWSQSHYTLLGDKFAPVYSKAKEAIQRGELK